MITKITESIFTAGYSDLEIDDNSSTSLVDVRHLVDKEGNSLESFIEQIDAAEKIYKTKGQVTIVCDMGISRSRIIAIGLLTRLGWKYDDALHHVRSVANKPEISMALLKSMKQHLELSRSPVLNRDNRTVIVLGGGGFVGSYITKHLSINRQVIAPSRLQINLLTDAIELDEHVEEQGCGTMIFAAHPKSHHTTKAFSDSLTMLKNALEVARQQHLKFVYISDLVVFSGNARCSETPLFEANETEIPVPWGTYAESKYLSEKLVQLYVSNHDIPASIVRPSALYGVGMSPTSLIPKLTRKAYASEEIVTHEYDNGLPIFELLHVQDFADAIGHLMDQENWPPVIHLGSKHTISTRDLAQQIVDLTNSSSKCRLMRISGEVQNIVSGTGGLIERLNWTPQITLLEGLKSIIFDQEHA